MAACVSGFMVYGSRRSGKKCFFFFLNKESVSITTREYITACTHEVDRRFPSGSCMQCALREAYWTYTYNKVDPYNTYSYNVYTVHRSWWRRVTRGRIGLCWYRHRDTDDTNDNRKIMVQVRDVVSFRTRSPDIISHTPTVCIAFLRRSFVYTYVSATGRPQNGTPRSVVQAYNRQDVLCKWIGKGYIMLLCIVVPVHDDGDEALGT